MQVGIVGAGRMGAGLARRLVRHGHTCVVYDPDVQAVDRLRADGVIGVGTLEELVATLEGPRIVWVMVPASLTGAVIENVLRFLVADDVVIDGGNSFYRDDVARGRALAEHGIHYVDVGTSGGVYGIERGFSLMIGGDPAIVERLDPIFRDLAPGVAAATRTPGRSGTVARAEHGYLHCGAIGAGHFVKMIHNGVEYGQMAALAEGMAILRKAGIGISARTGDTSIEAVADADFYSYDFDIAEILEVWRRGSVVSSWLVDLTTAAVHADPELSGFSGHVADSGEGRWTVQAAIDEGVPAHVLTAALYERFASRGEADYANKALSAMRMAFGGHMEKAAEA
ncbi:phosphogluconate dehydrogenase (NAD(+)-dependent, decarboxylating) [Nocardia noduli]|uniref:phosphogluconate dehydrogenase (NAD(+)-dependent, decarboxylating) n=1 Tax=Nocardia noduli TaxID=2815722 RepID=UPI001C22FD3C|nr:decarboxylating 6-phosphogluconate dehydrogenase [Nocardia noduli]